MSWCICFKISSTIYKFTGSIPCDFAQEIQRRNLNLDFALLILIFEVKWKYITTSRLRTTLGADASRCGRLWISHVLKGCLDIREEEKEGGGWGGETAKVAPEGRAWHHDRSWWHLADHSQLTESLTNRRTSLWRQGYSVYFQRRVALWSQMLCPFPSVKMKQEGTLSVSGFCKFTNIDRWVSGINKIYVHLEVFVVTWATGRVGRGWVRRCIGLYWYMNGSWEWWKPFGENAGDVMSLCH